ncbi:MAG: hypothetical protein V3V91_08965 [Thermoplasmata archaeon]
MTEERGAEFKRWISIDRSGGAYIYVNRPHRPVLTAACERLRQMEGAMSDSRALELICADFLAANGWPQEEMKNDV